MELSAALPPLPMQLPVKNTFINFDASTSPCLTIRRAVTCPDFFLRYSGLSGTPPEQEQRCAKSSTETASTGADSSCKPAGESDACLTDLTDAYTDEGLATAASPPNGCEAEAQEELMGGLATDSEEGLGRSSAAAATAAAAEAEAEAAVADADTPSPAADAAASSSKLESSSGNLREGLCVEADKSADSAARPESQCASGGQEREDATADAEDPQGLASMDAEGSGEASAAAAVSAEIPDQPHDKPKQRRKRQHAKKSGEASVSDTSPAAVTSKHPEAAAESSTSRQARSGEAEWRAASRRIAAASSEMAKHEGALTDMARRLLEGLRRREPAASRWALLLERSVNPQVPRRERESWLRVLYSRLYGLGPRDRLPSCPVKELELAGWRSSEHGIADHVDMLRISLDEALRQVDTQTHPGAFLLLTCHLGRARPESLALSRFPWVLVAVLVVFLGVLLRYMVMRSPSVGLFTTKPSASISEPPSLTDNNAS